MGTHPETIGPYQVIRSLGVGGMGEVLLADDPRLGRQVAIKRIRPDSQLDDVRRARFQREAWMTGRLSHPAIVQVFDLLTENGVDHIVMEYVPGNSLHRILDERGPLPLAEGLAIVLPVARGLACAHGHGVLHRDLKTENVLVSAEGQVKIVDFGIARLAASEGIPHQATLTAEGTFVGTYRAASPEQLLGERVDARTDLFSFGVLLYETFTGRSPFLGDDAMTTISRVLVFRQPPPLEVTPDLPAELSELIDHLLEKDPLLRPHDAEEVVNRLHGIAQRYKSEAAVLPSSASDGRDPSTQGLATVADGHRRSYATRAPAPTVDRGEGISRARGRRRLGIAVVALVVALGLGAAWTLVRSRPGPPRTVAVLDPEFATGTSGEEVELLAFAIRSALLQALTSFESISPRTATVDPTWIDTSSEEGTLDPAWLDTISGSPQAVARALGVDELLTSTLACRGENCFLALDRVRGEDGRLVQASQVPVPRSDLLIAAKAIRAGVRQVYPQERLHAGVAELTATPEDYAVYVEIMRAFRTRPESLALPALLDQLADLRERSPGFVQAYLLEAEIAVHRFLETRDRALLTLALALITQAETLAPGDPDVLFKRLYVEIQGGMLDAAEATLAALELLVPGDVRILDRRADILEKRGETVQALALCRTALERWPSWERFLLHARLARRLGQTEVARQSLEALLERSPGNLRGVSDLAYLEMENGDLHRAVELYNDLTARSPSPNRINNLGLCHMLLREHAASAAAFEQAAAAAPKNPFFLLNLADARSLGNRTDEALSLYRRVLALVDDAPTTGAQELTVRAQALAHLGEHREAVAAVQQALRLAPDTGPVAFEAALVYALVGDDTAAVVNAEQAIELGQGARWFRLPWFDELRGRSPDFAQLVVDHEDW